MSKSSPQRVSIHPLRFLVSISKTDAQGAALKAISFSGLALPRSQRH
ncbi:MAG: hypothetical protein F6K36_12450 [Symploca sp. SIO3C6]|uniref:Uncharacterized protein n=1 Tax=Symploca sp. SIO1C4 TaxID=2607765 RepID=A0A6B3NEG8_9CYAN|nr:hypothetical protein [Symploca sp. SIO3C6]NER29315.1 hypothetical protein [Symploca sp. SIO1C4]NET04141.1 hypothetical protein [Symploca sp. SIO2B6]